MIDYRFVLRLVAASALAISCGSPDAGRAEAERDAGTSESVPADDPRTQPPARPAAPADEASGDAAGDHADAAAAADVIRRYYAAIRAGEYAAAYRLWSGDGAASGQSLDGFVGGFARTADVEVEIGTAGRIEGAAGSRYVEIPVVVHATTTSGAPQRFEGAYTMRRSVVPGATADQRAWRIHSADLRPAR